jgi:CheY-like chemotaxis protein
MKKKLNCIVLVDDNEADNFLHSRLLKKSAIADKIEIALNGKEALDLLTGKRKYGKALESPPPPDLILLDINMPVMDGWEFLDEYQNLENKPKGKIVFIILTTSFNPADKVKAEKLLGGDCFYFKPLTFPMINEIIHNHFPDCK